MNLDDTKNIIDKDDKSIYSVSLFKDFDINKCMGNIGSLESLDSENLIDIYNLEKVNNLNIEGIVHEKFTNLSKGKEEKKEKIDNEFNEKSINKNKNNSNNNNKGTILIQLPPKHYTSEKIKAILSLINIDIEIKNKFKSDDKIKDLEQNMSDKAFLSIKRRNRNKEKKIKENNKKLGRKKKGVLEKGEHNKFSKDNIIKKIKKNLLKYLIIFINNILKWVFSYNEQNKKVCERFKIKKLDYNKIVNITNKNFNLQLLKMTLKDFISQDISKKFKNSKLDYNKRVIEEILVKEKNNEILNYVFNILTFGDWIDIFIYKRELTDFDNEKNKIIMNNLIRVDKLLINIYEEENDENYFSRFISILYNFERWFFIKKERKTKKTKEISHIELKKNNTNI